MGYRNTSTDVIHDNDKKLLRKTRLSHIKMLDHSDSRSEIKPEPETPVEIIQTRSLPIQKPFKRSTSMLQ